MAIDKRMASAHEAVADVPDGASVMISGFGGAGFANTLIRALRERAPRDLTLIVNSATHRYSLTHLLIEAKLVRRVISSAARGAGRELSPFEEQWRDGLVELECMPQGTFAERIRAGGAGIPAFYTPVGLGTEPARGKEVRRFGDRDYVMETAITADFALIRGDVADRYGNLAYRYMQANFGPAMATAARTTIAEVRAFSDAPLTHGEIETPGVFVKRVVLGE